MDLLTATLEVPPTPAAAGTSPGMLALLRELPVQLGIGAGLLVLGILLGRGSVRRPLPPMVEEAPAQPAPVPAAQKPAVARRVAALGIAAAIISAPALADVVGAAAPGSTAPSEAPRRLDDGAIFVPKASQRLLTIRTQLTEAGEASAAVRMIGTLVPDPNASGRVQPSQAGRLEPGERGFPALGQRVERGQVLAYVVPTYSAAERGGLIQNAAELDAQITILEARVRRLTSLRGTVAEREIQDAQSELAGARQRRTAIQPCTLREGAAGGARLRRGLDGARRGRTARGQRSPPSSTSSTPPGSGWRRSPSTGRRSTASPAPAPRSPTAGPSNSPS
jgi:hypothetical protein